MSPDYRLVCLLGLALLPGCGGYTVKQLEHDDELRRKVIAECLLMGADAVNHKNCKVAAKAEIKATGHAILELLND